MKYDKLIIVESPAKAKTIEKMIDNAIVIATKGHIFDLKKKGGVVIEDGKYQPKYEVKKDHKHIVDKIKQYSKNTHVYIASDEDREGEAIGWHVALSLGNDPLKYDRLAFHEITKSAILKAIESPRKLNIDIIKAQEARRILDRVVGFKLSPLLSKKVESRLSAGRVQSATLNLIYLKDDEINKFQPITFYNIDILFKKDIPATLVSYKDKKIKKLGIRDKKLSTDIVSSIEKDSFTITDISSKDVRFKPVAPFRTSTLQQAGNNELGWDLKKTMSVAQKLYEGQDTPDGKKGVITYMRTDHTVLAQEAVLAIREQIDILFGKKYLEQEPRVYGKAPKGAQEAHEAIRPTNIRFTPEVAKRYLDQNEHKLYTLIWNRTMMCQMSDSLVSNQTVVVQGKDSVCRLSGRKVIFDGWTKLKSNTKGDVILPTYQVGDKLILQSVKSEEKQTEPPAKYSGASIVKTMENLGIGRPSTYANTVDLLLNKNYVVKQGKSLSITDRGKKVIDFLKTYFPNIINSGFTSKMEEELDLIAIGQQDKDKMLTHYLVPLTEKVDKYFKSIPSLKPEPIPTGESCPKCNSPMVKRKGRFGDFEACSNYPKCKYIKGKKEPKVTITDIQCPLCKKGKLELRDGSYGEYYRCPKCKKNISKSKYEREYKNVK